MIGGIHRDRPGATALAAATGEPATSLGNDIWMSPGVSNAYAVGTDEGRVIINAGLALEGPFHRQASPRSPAPTKAVVISQGHPDHWARQLRITRQT